MKKHLLSVLLALLIAISGWAQDDYIIGDGSGSSEYYPISPYYCYSLTESLYLAEDEGMPESAGTITSYSLWGDKVATGRSIQIYMGNTDLTELSTSSLVYEDDMTLVFDGTVNFVADDWTDIELDEAFDYEGGNLVILTIDKTGTDMSYGTYPKWKRSTATSTRIVYYNNDYTLYGVSGLASSGYAYSYLPYIKLGFTEGGGSGVTCAKIPGSLTVSNVTGDGAELSWTATDEGSYQLQYKKSTESWDDITDIENLSDNTYTFVGLDAMTKYDVRVRNNCGSEQSGWKTTSFKTACVGLTATDLPKTWGFESSEGQEGGTSSYPLPACWERVSGNYPYTYNYYSNSGTYSLYWGYNNNGIAVLPYINTEELDITTLQLSFYASLDYNYSNSIEIGIMTDPSSESSFTTIESITLSNSYQLYEVPFNSYEGDGAYIAIRFNGSGTSNYAMIDDLTLEFIPDCPKPNNIAFTDIAAESATITWDQGDDNTSSWIVYYKQANSTEWSEGETVYEKTITLDELTASTSYQVKIAAVCGDDESAYPVSTIKTFKTPCVGLTLADLPKTWDFESGNTGGTSSYPLPECWQRVTSGTDPYTYYYSYYANSGNYSLCYSNYYGGPDAIVALPYITTESVEVKDLQLSFYARTYSGYSGTLEVGVLTDPTDANSFTSIKSISLTSTYTLYEVPFSAYEGEGAYMAIKIVSGSNYAYIDDVTLELTPECAKPNDVAVSDVTSTGAKVTWNQDGDNISSWVVYYRESGTDTWSEANANETEYSLTELKSATKYEVKIAAVCGDDESAYPNSALVSFSTECASLTENDLPKTWGFENDVTNSMPLCWLQTEGNYGDKAGVYGYYAKSGSKSLSVPVYIEEYDYYDYDYYYYAKDAAVALPPYSGDITNLQLTVWARPSAAASYLGTLQIGISTNPSDTTNFTLVYSKDATTMTANTYEEIICNFSEVEINDANATEFYPVIRFADVQNSSGYYSYGNWYLDDITLEVIPDCQKAQGLAATDIQSNEITVSWTQEDASSWNVYYRAKGTEEWQGPVSASETSATISNLEANTKYEIYVETVCGDVNPATVFITVKTLCGDQELPYTTSFEDENVNELPYCWTQVYTSTSYTEYPRVYGSYAKTGSHSLQFLCSSTDPTIIALPAVAESLQDLQLSFYSYVAGNASYYGTLKVGVTNSLTDTSAIEYVWSKDATQMTASTHTKEKISFTDIETTGDQLYIVFNRCNSSGYSWYIDDVKLEVTPECGEATQVTVTPADSYATITWNQTETEATSWVVYYKKSSDNDYTASDVVTEKTYTIEGLEPATSYSVYVETLCGESNPISDVVTFKTACTGLTLEDLPKTWGFETSEGQGGGTSSYPLPDCWQRNNAYYPYAYGYYANTGSYSLSFSSPNYYVSLPYINTESVEVNKLQVNLYARYYSYYSSSDASLKIGVMTDPDDVSTFTEVATLSLTDSYQLFEVPLNTYEGTGAYIAMTTPSSTTVYVDDVTLSLIPDCPKPNNLTLDVAATSAKVTWAQGGEEATSWVVYYKESSATEWTSETVSEMEYTIDELTPSTSYDVKVAAVCGEDESAWPVTAVKTFITPCLGLTSTDLPKTWGFEPSEGNNGGSTSYKLPNCWTRPTGKDYPYNYSSYGYNGSSYSLYFSSYSYNNFAVLPYIDSESLNIKDLQLSFYGRIGYSDPGDIQVGVVTDPNDVNTFTLVQTVNFSSSTYEEAEVSFANYEGTGSYIAIKTPYNYGAIYLDNVTLELIPECAKPKDLTFTEVTATSAKVSWTQENDDISSWIVYYRASGAEDWESENAYDKEYSLTDLSAATTYEVRVASVCGEENNPMSSIATFTTACAAISTLPYVQDFENATSYQMPNCWERPFVYQPYSNDVYPSVTTGSTYNNSNKKLEFHSNGTDRVFAVLPSFEKELSELQLSFYTRPEGSSSGTFYVGYMTDANDSNTFVAVESMVPSDFENTSTYEKREITFPAIELEDGQIASIAFAYVSNNAANWYWYVDNVTVDVAPECPSPKTVAFSNITAESAKVTWIQTGDNVSSWIVYYRENGTEDWNETMAYETESTLTDLTPATTYEVFIKAVCGNDEESYPSSDIKKFTTACVGLTEEDLPKTWDFESGNTAGTTDYPMPACWIKGASTSSSSYYPYVNSSSWAVINGGSSLYIGYGGNYTAVLPILDESLDASTLQVSFTSKKYYGSGYDANILVGVMTDPTDINSFTEIESIALTNSAEEYEVSLAAYTGEGKYIALRSETSNDYVFVDDLTLEKIPACAKINNTSVAATENDAVITINGAVEGTSYNVYYRKAGENTWSSAIAVTNGTATITGLDASSTYEYYVETVCDDGSNSISATKTFKTACGTVTTLPWVEEFTDMTESDLGCWTADNNSSKPWKFGTNYSYGISPMTDGGQFAYVEFGSSNEESWLISPVFDLSTQAEPYISFYSCRPKYSNGGSSELYLYYRTSDSEEWVEIWSETDDATYSSASGSLGWAKTTVALPNPSTTYQFAFKNICKNSNGTGLDSVYVYNDGEVIVPCNVPTNLTSSNVTETSFTVSWTGTAAKYNVQRDNQAPVQVTTNTYTFNNLTAGQTYTVKVQSVCDDGTTSAWSSSLSVTTNSNTPQPCNAPSDLAVTGQTQNSATIVWTGSAASYDVQLDNGAINNVTTTTYTFNNLTPNTSYSAKVRSNCGNGETSDWVTIPFKTDPAGAEDCAAPTNVQAVSVEQTTATITWEGEADSYDVQVGISEPVTVSAKSYNCTNLTANTTYTVKVRSNCSADKHSDWVSVVFTTKESSLNDAENIFSVVTYPNPTTANATLSVKGLTMDARVIVVDINGRVISEDVLKAGNETMEINSENLPSGVYYIRVISDEINKTQQLIKK